MIMKRLIVAAALATAFALPAYAQTAVQPQSSQFNLGRNDGQRHSVNPGFDVYQSGQYLGSDPDANIRLQLRRDNERDQY
jgi:opacity protein-like surface antigen